MKKNKANLKNLKFKSAALPKTEYSQNNNKKATRIEALIKNMVVVSRPEKRGAGSKIRQTIRIFFGQEMILDLKSMGAKPTFPAQEGCPRPGPSINLN